MGYELNNPFPSLAEILQKTALIGSGQIKSILIDKSSNKLLATLNLLLKSCYYTFFVFLPPFLFLCGEIVTLLTKYDLIIFNLSQHKSLLIPIDK